MSEQQQQKTPKEIKGELLDIFESTGFEASQIQSSYEDNFTFEHKNITYNINWSGGYNDVVYSIVEIEDCDFSTQFLEWENWIEDVPYFEDYLNAIKSGRWNILRKVWMALDDLEDDTIGKLPVEFEDILKEKYPLYKNSTDSPDLNGWLNGEEVSILDIKILSTELPKEKTSILDQDLITFLGETVSDISYSSKSEARKAIKSGAVTINGIKILDGSALVRSVGVLHDDYILIRRGKKNYSLVKLEPSK